ncbi:plasmid pRiA4b ORF-3 family protein [Alkaliphilus metalliredigens QYMF]|uniref:Plasmid pRiA4b ORF-3 family protein n=1 Tax=Alkaliphilus metalliredigens (strain QYMF) TaxID=293826 RepID=A6TJV8_ALKMQ|nr:plasmid pRiA4b ORF-3 family protein [Alkaliphilus metalliredigens]ABR46476.1 plasmid pRiA4b ORF-3 family protein [Alkaliphilus metalliredigens QYMF]
MKSYIIRIELEESNPLIWRRVVMPAGATFNRLHDIIQNVTNFQSGYPSSGYHLFEFDLTDENKIITNDEEIYLEHQHYKKNKAMYEERLQPMPPEMLQFEEPHQERLKREVRKPTGLKVDDYLEKYKEIRYAYDFGDDWHFIVKLESIVDDYYFGFPRTNGA